MSNVDDAIKGLQDGIINYVDIALSKSPFSLITVGVVVGAGTMAGNKVYIKSPDAQYDNIKSIQNIIYDAGNVVLIAIPSSQQYGNMFILGILNDTPANIKSGTIQSGNYVPNTSGLKIDLNNGTWDSKNFKISNTGDITANGGTIGGWRISSTQLSKTASAWVYPDYADYDLLVRYVNGTATLTPSQITAFDFDKNGVLNLFDVAYCKSLLWRTKTIEEISSTTGYVPINSTINLIIDASSGNKTVRMYGVNSFGNNFDRYFGVNGSSTSVSSSSADNTQFLTVSKDASVTGALTAGSLTVTGSKSREVSTTHGCVRMGAYEMPIPHFGDIGSSKILTDNKVEVQIESIFSDTIEISDYKINITPTTQPTEFPWVEKLSKSFIVHGNNGLKFDWEIKAPQKDYNYRFGTFDMIQEAEESMNLQSKESE